MKAKMYTQKEVDAIGKLEFSRGYLIACCNLQSLHGEASMAFDVLQECGIKDKEVLDMDLSEYDADALMEICKGRSGSPFLKGE